MKILFFIGFFAMPFVVLSQNSDYQIASYKNKGAKAPNTHYIGEAHLNALLGADEDFEYNITKATFKANSTLDWHKHASVQILIVVEGEGFYQERGKEPMIMKEGNVIKCASGIEHWHSSTKTSDVTYLALYGESQPTTWTEVLTLQDYDAVAKKLSEN